MSDPPWSTTVPDSRQSSGSQKVPLHDALAPGTRLDEFEILSVLGSGAFGIVYLAYDHVLVRRVAVKEYMPAALAGRRDGMPISLRSPAFATTFERGLDSFLSEARLLACFDHPALVKVHRFWRANDTAYMAMQHVPGETLKDVRLRMASPPDEGWLLALLEPLLDALEILHGQGVFHRDVSPDNILILPDGRPVLLDFGSARRVIGNGSQFLSAVVKPPFAPVEQYAKETEVRQGPWTDLYALGATLYFALLGQAPMPSVVRAVDDTLPELSRSEDDALAAMRGPLLATIDWMLAMAPDERPRDVAAARRALRGEIAVPPRAPRALPGAHDAAVANGQQASASHDDDAGPGAAAAASTAAPAGDAAGATSAPTAGEAVDEERPRARPPRHARRAVVALGLLGVAVFAGGAWTLNSAGRSSPALASLAAAWRTPAALPAARPATAMQAASPAPQTAMPAASSPALPPQLPVATSSVSPLVAMDPQPVFYERADGTPMVPVQRIEEPARTAKTPRGSRPMARGWSPTRAPDATVRLPVHAVAVRTRASVSRSAGQCEGLPTLSRMLCTLRACNAPGMSAEPKCVRSRHIEQARQRRMERE
jgi:hypothetical protein